jgi:hypothetical protein
LTLKEENPFFRRYSSAKGKCERKFHLITKWKSFLIEKISFLFFYVVIFSGDQTQEVKKKKVGDGKKAGKLVCPGF